jgi:hypothetical protein
VSPYTQLATRLTGKGDALCEVDRHVHVVALAGRDLHGDGRASCQLPRGGVALTMQQVYMLVVGVLRLVRGTLVGPCPSRRDRHHHHY